MVIVWVDVLVLGLLVLFYILAARSSYGKKGGLQDIFEEKESFSFLLPMSLWIITRTRLDVFWEKRGRNKEYVEAVEVGADFGKAKLRFLSRISARIILFLFLSCVLSLMLAGKKQSSELIEGSRIKRPVDGGGQKIVNLHLEAQEDTKYLEKDMAVTVEGRKLKKEEFLEKAEEMKKKFPEAFLGENISSSHVTGKLDFFKTVPGTMIEIRFQTGIDSPVQSDGTILSDAVSEQGEDTVITVEFAYGEWKEEAEYAVRVYPEEKSWEEGVEGEIVKAMEKAQEESQEKGELRLPQHIGETRIRYEEKAENKAAVILIAGFLAAGILAVSARQKLQKQVEKRELELQMDYPEIMGKFTLLLGAGMTMKGAWMKIVSDYLQKRENGEEGKRYAYEEMLVTCREMENGVTEGNAYDNFGRRVKLLPYLKFTTLLVQNMRKGSKGMAQILEYEAAEAYVERKEVAKRIGEKAGTRLLIPMVIMMTLVFALIMIPAFFSFSM